jgi:hypothetical protein
MGMNWKSKWFAGALAAGGLVAGIGAVTGASAVSLVVCGPAAAQETKDQQAEPDRAAFEARMKARREAEHAAHKRLLHDALSLRPDQEAAFAAFDAAMAPPPPPGDHDHEGMAKLTTPERLDLEARRMAEHQAHFQRMAAATKAFYAALDPAQRRTFDALGEMMGPRHGPGGPRGGPHGGPRGPGGPDGPPPGED